MNATRRPDRRGRTAAVVLFLVLRLAFAAWLITQTNLSQADQIGSVVAMFAALIGLPPALRDLVTDRNPEHYPTTEQPTDFDLCRELADRARNKLEHPHTQNSATAIPTRWTAGPAWLQSEPEPAAPPGPVPNFAAAFQSTPWGRLVVLGDAGFGKSYLASRLAVDLIKQRRQADPVPVVLNLCTLDSVHDVKAWVTRQLVESYDETPDHAQRLVDKRRIIPILDGSTKCHPPASYQ